MTWALYIGDPLLSGASFSRNVIHHIKQRQNMSPKAVDLLIPASVCIFAFSLLRFLLIASESETAA